MAAASASVLARNMIKPLRLQTLLKCPHRTLHSSAIFRKQAAKSNIDHLFAEKDSLFEEDEDLVKDSVVSKPPPPPPPSSSPVLPTSNNTTRTKGRKRAPLSSDVKLERFDSLLLFMKPRIVGEQQKPMIRKRSWLTLLDLAANKEQMQKVVDLFPNYKDPRGFPDNFSLAFTRRCHELFCPELALTVFGNFARYHLPLTLSTAQWLIHSLYIYRHPISQTLLAASYYPVYNLPHISQDLPTAAMVAAACYNDKHKTTESVQVAKALFPHISKMWADGQEKIGIAKTVDEARINKWVSWSLMRLNNAVSRDKEAFVVPPEVLPSRIEIDGPAPASHLNVLA